MDSPLISRKFSIAHVEFNELAIRLGLDNKLPSKHISEAERLGKVLDTVETPFVITSWYRSLQVEREYGRKQFAAYCISNRLPLNDSSWSNYHDSTPHSRAAAVCLMSPDLDSLVKELSDLGEVEVYGNAVKWLSFTLEDTQ